MRDTDSLTLHYAPDNASLIVRMALIEAGLPFATTLVDRRTRAQDSPAFRALNPAGLIPVLETPEGPLAETGAILLWLADRHPTKGLAPPPGHPQRGAFLRWLFLIANTAHADLRQVFYAERYAAPEAIPAYRATMAARMNTHFRLLNDACAADPGLFAAPSILAPYLCALLRWSVLYPADMPRWFDLAAFPALQTLARMTEARPAALATAAAEGLGPLPFSQPQPCRPPEGAAL